MTAHGDNWTAVISLTNLQRVFPSVYYRQNPCKKRLIKNNAAELSRTIVPSRLLVSPSDSNREHKNYKCPCTIEYPAVVSVPCHFRHTTVAESHLRTLEQARRRSLVSSRDSRPTGASEDR